MVFFRVAPQTCTYRELSSRCGFVYVSMKNLPPIREENVDYKTKLFGQNVSESCKLSWREWNISPSHHGKAQSADGCLQPGGGFHQDPARPPSCLRPAAPAQKGPATSSLRPGKDHQGPPRSPSCMINVLGDFCLIVFNLKTQSLQQKHI